MRPVSVFAKGPGSEIEQLRADLRGRWRQAARAVMVLLSLHGLPRRRSRCCWSATRPRCAAGSAGSTARGWPGWPTGPGPAGRRWAAPADQADRRAAGPPGPWTLPRIRRYLGWPQVSMRTLYRRVRLVAIWRRPKLTARGDPYHDHVVAGIVARLIELPRRAVVLAEDETHLNLLPHVRASWTLRATRPKIPTPGSNRQVTVLGALEVTTGRVGVPAGPPLRRRLHRLAGRMLTEAFPLAPAIVVICDNDSIHHARAVTRLPGETTPAGTAVRRPVQPARQPRRANLGRPEELRRQHRRHLARPPQTDPLLLPQPLTGPDARRCCPWTKAAAQTCASVLMSSRATGQPPSRRDRCTEYWDLWAASMTSGSDKDFSASDGHVSTAGSAANGPEEMAEPRPAGGHPFGRVLRTRGVARLAVFWLMAFMPIGMTPLATVLTLREYHYPYLSAGMVLGAHSVGIAVSGPFTGRLMDRIGLSKVLVPLRWRTRSGWEVLLCWRLFRLQ